MWLDDGFDASIADGFLKDSKKRTLNIDTSDKRKWCRNKLFELKGSITLMMSRPNVFRGRDVQYKPFCRIHKPDTVQRNPLSPMTARQSSVALAGEH